jgi:hypothetical protein
LSSGSFLCAAQVPKRGFPYSCAFGGRALRSLGGHVR